MVINSDPCNEMASWAAPTNQSACTSRAKNSALHQRPGLAFCTSAGRLTCDDYLEVDNAREARIHFDGGPIHAAALRPPHRTVLMEGRWSRSAKAIACNTHTSRKGHRMPQHTKQAAKANKQGKAPALVDAVQMLEQDHRAVEGLFKEFASGNKNHNLCNRAFTP